MTMKIASYWGYSNNRLDGGIPTIAEIEKYKQAGFDTIIFAEIRAGQQMQDFDAIFAGQNNWNTTTNPIKTTIQNIKSAGLKAYFLLNANRYNGIYQFLYRPADKLKFINALKYLVSLGIDGIQLEEVSFYAAKADVTAFFRECKNLIPAPITYSCNMASGSDDGLIDEGIDWITINNERLFSFIQIQPGKQPDPPYAITEAIILNAVTTQQARYFNIPVSPGLYRIYSTKIGVINNVNLLSNIQFVMSKNWDFTFWPVNSCADSEFLAIKALIGGVPTTGRLDIRSTPPGASIRISSNNGLNWGAYGVTPRIKDLSPGTYLIELSLAGYPAWTTTVPLSAGSAVVVEHSFALPPPPNGSIMINSTPKANLKLNGVSIDMTPQGISGIGTYYIELSLQGYDTITDTITLVSGDNRTANYTLVPSIRLTSIVLTGCNQIQAGSTCQLVHSCFDQNGQAMTCSGVVFTSHSPAIASVSSSGILTAISPGNVIISVKSGVITTYKEILVTASIPTLCSWIQSNGGIHPMPANNISILIRAYLGYENLGFAVTSSHISGAISYYLGYASSGNSLTGCGLT